MRDRLIELIFKAEGQKNNELPSVEEIADYLLENGVIVLKQDVDIKIGQVVYMVYPTRIRKLKVHDINYKIEKTGCSIYYYCEVLNENVCDLFFQKDIGYTTFLTKEEAEAKLREYTDETK